MGAIYITNDGIVEVLSSGYYGCDIENPLDISILNQYLFEDIDKDDAWERLTIDAKQRYIFFGVSKEKNSFIIEKHREDANFGFFYVSLRDVSRYFRTSDIDKIIKRTKEELKDCLKKYEHFLNDDVCCSLKNDFCGNEVEAYFDLFGNDLADNGAFLMMGEPIGDVYYGPDFFIEKAFGNTYLSSENILDYFEKKYKITRLDNLYEVNFGEFSDIFSKEDLIPEIYTRAKTTKEFRPIYNEMVLTILKESIKNNII